MAKTEIIYGVRPVAEALRSGRRALMEIILAAGRGTPEVQAIADEAAARGLAVRQVPRDEIGRLTEAKTHQGVLARVAPYPYVSVEAMQAQQEGGRGTGLVLVLDGITDPQNVGALIRTASLMGVEGVVLPRDNAASITPTVVKASAGATEHMKIAQVTNIVHVIEDLKKKEYWIAGASGSGEKNIYQHDFKGYSIVLVLGSEGKGLRRLVQKKCDFLLSIPMTGNISSYNVSVAGALILGEVVRQRRYESPSKSHTEICQNS